VRLLRLSQLEKSNDLVGNRNHYFPVSIMVPEPTVEKRPGPNKKGYRAINSNKNNYRAINNRNTNNFSDRLCGLVVRVSGYRSRDPRLDSRRYQIF
jgi:hypothetical protein